MNRDTLDIDIDIYIYIERERGRRSGAITHLKDVAKGRYSGVRDLQLEPRDHDVDAHAFYRENAVVAAVVVVVVVVAAVVVVVVVTITTTIVIITIIITIIIIIIIHVRSHAGHDGGRHVPAR